MIALMAKEVAKQIQSPVVEFNKVYQVSSSESALDGQVSLTSLAQLQLSHQGCRGVLTLLPPLLMERHLAVPDLAELIQEGFLKSLKFLSQPKGYAKRLKRCLVFIKDSSNSYFCKRVLGLFLFINLKIRYTKVVYQ